MCFVHVKGQRNSRSIGIVAAYLYYIKTPIDLWLWQIHTSHQLVEFCHVIVYRSWSLPQILQLLIHDPHIIMEQECGLICFNCCHHGVAFSSNLVSTKGTLRSLGTPLKSKISPTTAIQSRNFSGWKQSCNSRMLNLNPNSYLLVLPCTMGCYFRFLRSTNGLTSSI